MCGVYLEQREKSVDQRRADAEEHGRQDAKRCFRFIARGHKGSPYDFCRSMKGFAGPYLLAFATEFYGHASAWRKMEGE